MNVQSGSPVCVIGAGTMGQGIAQTALMAGHSVALVDLDARQLAEAFAAIAARLERRHPRLAGQLDGLLHAATDIRTVSPDPLPVVIEAVTENLTVKHAVLQRALDHFGPDVRLATNTSSLSITEVAAGVSRPEQVVGVHFFNPVPVMRLVEVIPGVRTPPSLVSEMSEMATRWGKTVAVARSTPGFIVNRVIRPFYAEGLRLAEESVADIPTIDALLRGAGGFPMGPFELMDLVGTDVNDTVTRTVWEAFGYDPRYSPSLLQRELVASGRLGRKSGHGFYDYRDDQASAKRPVEPRPPRRPLPPGVSIRGTSADLTPLAAQAQLAVDPDHAGHAHIDVPGVGLILSTRGATASEEAQLAGRPVAVLDRALDIGEASSLAFAVAGDRAHDLEEATVSLLAAAGVGAYRVDDAPGLVVARVVSMIINEAVDAVHKGVAVASDIDAAMRLGAGFPLGPLAWADRWSPAYVLGVLDSLSDETRDPRYRASRMLRAAARNGRAFGPTPAHG